MAEKAPAKIRKFKIEDINKILEIEEQAFPKTAYSKGTILEIEEQAFPKTAYSKGTFLSYANSFPDNFIVIEAGKDIVGYIIFDISGHIHSTAVKSTYRRKGFGKMLFMHASKCAKKRLWLEVRSKNSGAIKFYKRLGMKIIGKIPDYYRGDDALIMALSQ